LDGLIKVMTDLDLLWRKSGPQVRDHASHIRNVIKIHLETIETPQQEMDPDLEKLRKKMDMKNGGFGTGAKFPLTGALEFLLTEGTDDGFLALTLDRMARGGMFDHVEGGFFRCVVDAGWEKPQFEKLLCDNALLASLYSRAAVVFGNGEYEYTARRTLDFMREKLGFADGAAFFSSIADNGSQEGERYTWEYEEAVRIIGQPRWPEKYQMTAPGNIIGFGAGEDGGLRTFHTGRNVLARKDKDPDAGSLELLRKSRVIPPGQGVDEKIISAWQGMAMSAFARAAAAFKDIGYLSTAERIGGLALELLLDCHFRQDGAPLGSPNLEDGAYLAMGFWDLFECTGDDRWLQACRDRVDSAKARFSAGDGGYYLEDGEDGVSVRPRNFEDQPYPSAAALLARVDWRLSFALGQAQRVTHSATSAINLLWALKGGGMLGGEAMSLHREVFCEPVEILYSVAGGEQDLLPWIRSGWSRKWGILRIPLGGSLVNPALSFGRAPAQATRAFVCYDRSCLPPAKTPGELEGILRKMRYE
ncbi:MAG: hypothetical protein OEV92_09335, partial [Nitrospinota bacterium]|nr:hypothetical protein [Nitrospinota bacterium]